MEGVSSAGIFILTKTIVAFRVQNLFKIVITYQIMTCLLVIPNLIVLPYPNLRVTLSKLTYYPIQTYVLPYPNLRTTLSKLTYFPIQTANSTQTGLQALNRAMRAKLESQDPAEQGDKTKILHIEFLR